KDPLPPYPLRFDFAFEYVDSDQDWANALITNLEAKNKRVYRELWKIGPDGVPLRPSIAPSGIGVECRAVCAGDSTPAGWAEGRIQKIQDLQDIQPSFRFVPVVLGSRMGSLRELFPRIRFWADSTNAEGLLLGTSPEVVTSVTPVDDVKELEERTSRFLQFV